MASPTEAHHRAALGLLRFLKQSPDKGIFFPINSDLQILGFSDADWGVCIDSRRSIAGYCFFVGHSLVSWKSKILMSCGPRKGSSRSNEATSCVLSQSNC
jgi:hypothetical protein